MDCIINPSNKFAENLWKFTWIFPGNPWISGNSQESFTGKSSENVDSYSEEFLVTHSEELGWGFSCNPFWGNSHNSISCNQLQGISCYQFCRKTGEKVDKIWGNSFFSEKSSSEPIPGNFLGTIPKIFSRVPQEYLKIFSAYSWIYSLTRNNLTTILPLQLFRSITKSECYSRFWSYWSCHVFCLFR